jgi:hypothetical protein
MKKNCKKPYKYLNGSQNVTVPPKGGVMDVAGPTMGMATTGRQIGSMFGPMGSAIGTGVGAVVGLAKGVEDFTDKNEENRRGEQLKRNMKQFDNKEVLLNLQAKSGYLQAKNGLRVTKDTLSPKLSNKEYQSISRMIYKDGSGKIVIKPENKGKFTAAASKVGMGVQEFASHVLSNKDKYSSTQIKRANFAKNASKWKK